MKLIVVDDNSLEREGIQRMIQSFGLEVDVRASFDNGKKALEYLKSEKRGRLALCKSCRKIYLAGLLKRLAA